MIKFFRKTRQQMINENKTSKYLKYAIGEIVLVVIGILIALSINNWNQSRIENQKELVLLQQLLEDFNANKKMIQEGIESYQVDLKHIMVTLFNTGPNVEIPSQAIFDSIGVLNYTKINLVYGTNIVLSAQQIDRLKNERLKIALSAFPSALSSYKEYENVTRGLALEQRKLHQKYISLLSREDGFKQVIFKSDTLGWFRDRDFQNITVDRKWQINNVLSELKNLNKKNNIILKLINNELTNYN